MCNLDSCGGASNGAVCVAGDVILTKVWLKWSG